MEKIAASIAQIAAEALIKAGADAQAEAGLSADLPPPVADGLMAWIAAQPEPKPTVRDAIGTALSEWLTARGFLLPGNGQTSE